MALLPAPAPIAEYAETCTRYVLASLGVALDFCAETLPILDHYLRQSRQAIKRNPESIPLLAAVAGAYIGEVLRSRHPCHWRLDSDDPLGWRLEFSEVPLTVLPVVLAHQAIHGASDTPGFVLPADEQDLVSAKLDDLPKVSEDEFLAPSTRVEVVDIIVDAIRAYRARRKLGAPPDDESQSD